MKWKKASYVAPVLMLVVATSAWFANDRTDSQVVTTSATISQTTLPRVTAPPDPRFSRDIFAAADLDDSIRYIDKCAGPVAIDVGDDQPVLIAEHDYCGGSAWISELSDGDAVSLSGPGVNDGLYVVQRQKVETRGKADVGDLPAGDVVLQTCISKTELVLVGLTKYQAETAQAA